MRQGVIFLICSMVCDEFIITNCMEFQAFLLIVNGTLVKIKHKSTLEIKNKTKAGLGTWGLLASLFNNFRTSGHTFSADENLERFRFSLLNINLAVAIFFSGLSYFLSTSGFAPFHPIYEKILLGCTAVFALCIYPLRANKYFYIGIARLTILNSLVFFYSALLVSSSKSEDEFRLIWFFLLVFACFMYFGKKHGIILAVWVIVSIGVINQFHDLGFSRLSEITFTTSFIIFTLFVYNFFNKVEQDEQEFKKLNLILKKTADKEIHQREQQEKMLLQQYRMANMGGMLDAIAHQWRQPLMNVNAILMNMGNALEDTEHKNKAYLEDKIDNLASLTQHMSHTIEDFRSLLKVGEKPTQFSLQTAVSEALLLMKNSLNKVIVDFDAEGNCDVLGHKSELMQIIIIILSNAVEVLDGRGVEVQRITIKTSIEEHKAVISIQDNAGGITFDSIDDIFDPYFTTKQQSGGTGLGLYIAKIITEQRMHGCIQACNVADGAKFTLSFNQGLNQ